MRVIKERTDFDMKKAISVLVCMALVITMFPASVMAESKALESGWDGSIATEFAGGNGTESEPYQISNEAELAFLARMVNEGNSYLGCYFVLMEDLNLSGNEWHPIGNKETPFEGHFDGMKHSIFNLTINSNEDYVGLFGFIGRNGGLSNINLDYSRVSGKQYVGIIAGSNNGGITNCIISDSEVDGMTQVGGVMGETAMNVGNCIVQGTQIKGKGNYIGGIIGYADLRGHNYTIESCGVKTSSIDGENSVGGVIGYKDQGDSSAGRFGIDIIGCYNIGSNVTGIENIGGILGDAYNWYTADFLNVSECCNSGTIIGDNFVGGIVGNQIGKFNNGYFDLKNCFNIGDITATDNYAAGICGATAKNIRNCHNVGNVSSANVAANICAATGVTTLGDTYYATIENCYYLKGTDKNATKLSPDEMKDKDVFLGWDFENTWRLDNGKYPELRIFQNEENSEKEFNYYTYRADWLQGDSEGAKYINHKLGLQTPAFSLVNVLKNEEKFGNSLKAWEGFDFFFRGIDKGPSALYETELKREDVYEAIILDALHVTLQQDILDRCEEQYKDFEKNLDVVLKNWNNVGELTEKEVFQGLTETQKQELGTDLIEGLELSNSVVEGAQMGFNVINAGVELADCFESFCDQIYAGLMMIEMSDELKVVVRKMYTFCPEEQSYMKQALKSCVDVIDLSVEQFLKKVENDKIAALGKEGLVIISQVLWDSVKNVLKTSFPYVDLFLGAYSTGKMLSNQLFNTDDVVEKYLHMLALTEFEVVMKKTLAHFESDYLDKELPLGAKRYLAAADLSFSFKGLDCKDAYEFVDEIGQGLVNQITFDKNEYTDLKNSFKGFQTQYKYAYDYFQLGWLESLKGDYPEKYEAYMRDKATLRRTLDIECPVDVLVFDKDNNLVGYSKDGKVWSSQRISLLTVGEKKKIFFYDEDKYTIKYIGNGVGKMNITFKEYDLQKSNIRSIFFHNLPLIEGLEYEGYIEGKVLESSAYKMINKNSESQKENLDTLDSEQTRFCAEIVNGYFDLSKGITQTDDFIRGERVLINTMLPKNSKFIKWTSDVGDEIFEDSKSKETSFIMPDEPITIKALIECENTTDNNTLPPTPSVSTKSLTVTCGNGGSISPSESVKVNYGENQTFTITPDEGYEIEDVLVDGKSIGAVDTYTFEQVTQNHTISATFKKKATVDDNDVQSALSKKIKAAKSVKIKAWSSVGRNKDGKRYIKVQWSKKGAAVTGYQVYRSYKRTSGYKKFFTTKNRYYFNTKQLKKGQRHYYKVRAYTKINGKNYYSKWSNLAYRKLK